MCPILIISIVNVSIENFGIIVKSPDIVKVVRVVNSVGIEYLFKVLLKL